MPVEDRSRFTSAFGKRDIDNGPRDHWGIDFGGPSPGESVFVKAAADGVVEWIKTIPLRSGPAIGLRHADGSLTAYLHTRRHKVKRGQKVKRGEVIAETWHTGIKLSNGIHLHFEWWKDYRDHRSVFNPIQRLAANGWVIRDGRLYDEKPAALTPAATIPTGDWSDMATENEIRNIFREEIRDLPADVWAHLLTTPEGKEAYASTLLAYGRRDAGNAAASANASARLTEKIATRSGMDRDEVAQIIRDAITESVQVEGVLHVTSKEK